MILAIDPGLATCGYAVVGPKGRLVELGVIISPTDAKADDTTDRARRADRQADVLLEVARRHRVITIAAEAVSLGGPPRARLPMGMCLCLSWGVLLGIARAIDAEVLELPPKRWQHAIVKPTGKRAKVDYAKVYDFLDAFIAGSACKKMALAIAKNERNHAYDATGIGVFAAMAPGSANVIRARGAAFPVERKDAT